MPIVTSTPTTPKPVEAQTRIEPKEYRGVTVDTRYTPRKALQAYITGSAYVVTYFEQLLGVDSGVSGLQVNRDPSNQQYRRINKFELKVTTALEPSQDEESNKWIVQGSANVYGMLIPNVGDMFFGDVGDGQEGVFQVTASRQKSIKKDATYEIDFQMTTFTTPAIRADLERKTIETVVFVKNLLNYNHNPYLHLEDYDVAMRLGSIGAEIADMYFKTFWSSEYQTLILPDQEFITYDHFLTSAVLSLFDTYDTPEVRYVRKLNVDGDPVMKVTTIWDALLKRSVMYMKRSCTRVGLVGVHTFNKNAMLEGIYYTGVAYVAYPYDPERSIVERDAIKKRTPQKSIERRPEGKDVSMMPLIPKVGETDYYVFTEAFYNDTEGQSKLEVLTRDYLEEKALDNRALLEIANSYLAWEPIEQFYCAPVLLLLIKMTVRGF